MTHVDATSRAPVEEAEDTMDQVIQNCLEVDVVRSEQEEVAALQYRDPKNDLLRLSMLIIRVHSVSPKRVIAMYWL